MTRRAALLILLALWAGFFLPAIGSIEIKGGEEGRRILPAITMLETGNWIVPYIGGEPYLRKPPLLNWIIAGSFQLTGLRAEWTARLPSALAVLALAVVLIGAGSRWLTPGGALLASIFALANLGMLEKGRLAEIEALYAALTGMALVCWLVWWREERSPWLTWLVPFALLGVGLLAKGPLHLLFFYAAVVAVLWQAGRLRELRRAPHLVGVAVMLAIFALWAVPYLQSLAKLRAAGVWQQEFAGRVGHARTFGIWLEEVWNHFENFLPWLLFAPLWWSRRIVKSLPQKDADIFRGLRAAVVFCAACLFFTPGVAARYTLPLVVPASLLTAMALRAPELLPGRLLLGWRSVLLALFGVALAGGIALPFVAGFHLAAISAAVGIVAIAAAVLVKRAALSEPVRLGVATGAVVVCGVLVFAVARVPRITASESSRPLARDINAALPDVAELHIIDPGYRPAFFYVRPRCIYHHALRELPPGRCHALLRASSANRLPSLGRTSQLLARFSERGEKELLLVELGEQGKITPPPAGDAETPGKPEQQ